MQTLLAYSLVFHGSHDLRSQTAAKQLTDYFRQKIQHQSHLPQALGQDLRWTNVTPPTECVATASSQQTITSLIPTPILVQDAYLECHSLTLHEQIIQFIQSSQPSSQFSSKILLTIIPVFLLAGVHVIEDIPTEVAIAQQRLASVTALRMTPHLGSHMGLCRIVNEQMSCLPMEAWILLAHGSRRAGVNDAIADLATHLGAVPAFWSTPSGLETQIQALATLGFRRIGIFPYFLFSGGITDAIAQTVTQLAAQFPHLTLTLTQPFDFALPQLADLLMNLAQSTASAS
ncbi:MAG: sirohydrochlorin chelatase [Oscillatoriales cyanobacterium C42_A2020_001]|nr:sirohydrochlorin chelatase [Leptolyngbyaceae cyanobacterium C42_A2020_001]